MNTTANGWNLIISGEYVMHLDGTERRFVARCKRGGTKDLARFLVKHFTPAEYFAAYVPGSTDRAHLPLGILESKGYVLPHVRKWLKADGFPPTLAGYEAWRGLGRDRVAA